MSQPTHLTYGFEAEFLNLSSTGRINNLSGVLVLPEDEVGVDGHTETLELRTKPTGSVQEQFRKISEGIAKYALLLEGSHGSWGYTRGIRMRGGAYYGTPLSIHLHFGNLDPVLAPPMVVLLQSFLNDGLAKQIDSLAERTSRLDCGYGWGDLDKCIRVKGPLHWEWRQPSSIFTPACTKLLLGTGAVLAKLLLLLPKKEQDRLLNTFRATVGRPAPPLHEALRRLLEHYYIAHHLAKEEGLDVNALANLAERVISRGRVDWNQDLLPSWIGRNSVSENAQQA